MGWIEKESGGRMGMNRKGEWREDGVDRKGEWREDGNESKGRVKGGWG